MTVLQGICKFFMSKECMKRNYTVSELAIEIGVTEQSVRTAVRKGLKMDVLSNESHGSFRLYRLGKHGKLVASLPVKFKTYADLSNTLGLLIDRREIDDTYSK